MKLYIDKSNLISLVNSKNSPEFMDCADLIRRHFDVKYNFPKNDVKTEEHLMAWFSKYGQGVGGNALYFSNDDGDKFPPRPVKSNFYNNGTSDLLTSVYLLDDEHICDVISSKSCILIGKKGEELKVLTGLIMDNTEIPAVKITSWGDYLPKLPLTDIIISDNHYFKSQEAYKKNDNDLIRFLSNIPKDSPVNVIIITKEGEIDKNLNLEEEQRKIKEIVKKASGSTKSSVTIVTTYKSHDRSLITNYYRIKHGSCFHLKSNGLKSDVTTEIKSHGKKQNEEMSKYLLSIYQEIASSPVRCYGDKKSNFLNF
ncbi:hypothetical protein [Prevotella sp. P6B1]|uniref:hypothetical protein n=1 Tax=Prevotella sp. P6B1 TaxID=1410613 RepID=UPI00051AD048|nr:hypothetical protein [Prevotella sp. P6B1]